MMSCITITIYWSLILWISKKMGKYPQRYAVNLIVFWKKNFALLLMFYQCTIILSKLLLRRTLHLRYRKWTHNNNRCDNLCFVVTVTNKFVDVMLNYSLMLDRMTFSKVGKIWTEFLSEPIWFLKKNFSNLLWIFCQCATLLSKLLVIWGNLHFHYRNWTDKNNK